MSGNLKGRKKPEGAASGEVPLGFFDDAGQETENLGLEERRLHLEAVLVRKGVLAAPERQQQGGGSAVSSVGQAVRLSSEFLAAVVVGVVLGLGFDRITGLTPWGLLVFLLLGFAAGTLNILRMLGTVPSRQIGQNSASRDGKESNSDH